MNSSAAGEITRLLIAWRGGERDALNQLTPAVYSELRRMAHRAMWRQASIRCKQPHRSMRPSGSWRKRSIVACRDCSHFLALRAQLMKRIPGTRRCAIAYLPVHG